MDFAGVRASVGSLLVTGIAQGAVASGFVSVKIAGTAVSCLADRGLTTASGDLVYGCRINNRIIIIGRVWPTAPAAPDESQTPPPAPEAVTRYGTTVIAPVETRSYRPNWGWRTDNDDVYQGQYGNNGVLKGCAFYGKKPRSLASVTVTSASIKVKRVRGSGWISPQSTTLWRITNKTKPAGAPTFTGGSTSGPRIGQGETDTFTIPDSFAQDLVDGTAGGLCLYDASGDPYVRMEGRSGWSPAFSLTIHWRRVS